jgi:hypothetical protein
MHSNFVTPPDYVETVLVLNATEEQIRHLGAVVQDGTQAYNVYFYREEMNDPAWFDKISIKADIVLDAKTKDPLTYFDK